MEIIPYKPLSVVLGNIYQEYLTISGLAFDVKEVFLNLKEHTSRYFKIEEDEKRQFLNVTLDTRVQVYDNEFDKNNSKMIAIQGALCDVIRDQILFEIEYNGIMVKIKHEMIALFYVDKKLYELFQKDLFDTYKFKCRLNCFNNEILFNVRDENIVLSEDLENFLRNFFNRYNIKTDFKLSKTQKLIHKNVGKRIFDSLYFHLQYENGAQLPVVFTKVSANGSLQRYLTEGNKDVIDNILDIYMTKEMSLTKRVYFGLGEVNLIDLMEINDEISLEDIRNVFFKNYPENLYQINKKEHLFNLDGDVIDVLQIFCRLNFELNKFQIVFYECEEIGRVGNNREFSVLKKQLESLIHNIQEKMKNVRVFLFVPYLVVVGVNYLDLFRAREIISKCLLNITNWFYRSDWGSVSVNMSQDNSYF
jgi:hypothetical protein